MKGHPFKLIKLTAVHGLRGTPMNLISFAFNYSHQHHAHNMAQLSWRSVRISALALLKMAMHAKSGGNIEIMGMLYGKVQGDTFIVIDAFALPVEGTETRVNAQAEAYEYMVDFAETNRVGTIHSLRLHTIASQRGEPPRPSLMKALACCSMTNDLAVEATGQDP